MRQRAFIQFNQPVLSTFNAIARELEKDLELMKTDDEFYENDAAYLASIDLPGVDVTSINVELEENRLSLSAERKDPFKKNAEVKKYSRVFTLPKNIEYDKINAHYENGVLHLTLPKVSVEKTKKKITVQVGERPQLWNQPEINATAN